MFTEHQPVIADFAQASPEGLARVAQFVFCTIRRPLHTVPTVMRDVDEHGAQSRHLLGPTRLAFATWQAKRVEHWEQLTSLHAADDEHGMLAYASAQHGLGLAKGGFLLQLAFGRVGCLDTHNLKRFNMTYNAVRLFKSMSADSRRARIATYLQVCERWGGTATLWDSWCEYVAERQQTSYRDATHVSWYHPHAILDTLH